MNLLGFLHRKTHDERIKALEEEVRQERGVLAVNIMNFKDGSNPLDVLVKQHLELLQRGHR